MSRVAEQLAKPLRFTTTENSRERGCGTTVSQPLNYIFTAYSSEQLFRVVACEHMGVR